MGSDFTVLLRGGGDPSVAPVKWGLGLEYNAKETVTQVSTKDLVVYLCFTAHHSHDNLHSSSGKELMGTYRSYKEIQWSPPFGEGKLPSGKSRFYLNLVIVAYIPFKLDK